ncbi:MAG: hypothetical protein AVDCRST_MAG69-2583, partial [uncultured Solirubrobacteraceae bacterium]
PDVVRLAVTDGAALRTEPGTGERMAS